ncbi:hypothetical protein SARC_06904 [Sphaeroforma arctica JP610]|uniref:Uncharacterized protein n=1 Tax=Sphaeroforma arctica JP610 TaxID=667725 RepID=A0A0L0FV92_9EUKA|nr:hypothetical protein SARC_06904 [Sphaeroforma arctica JP610]KNC80747.1 hypothetical protein SARC_06904 [Sphaeroforma arctica JP610]|eukprot:XP_014154649.1 hypothetical protein SARC_06904 [Sphaeroforma arctica JP610]
MECVKAEMRGKEYIGSDKDIDRATDVRMPNIEGSAANLDEDGACMSEHHNNKGGNKITRTGLDVNKVEDEINHSKDTADDSETENRSIRIGLLMHS